MDVRGWHVFTPVLKCGVLAKFSAYPLSVWYFLTCVLSDSVSDHTYFIFPLEMSIRYTTQPVLLRMRQT